MKKFVFILALVAVACQSGPSYEKLAKDYILQRDRPKYGPVQVSIARVEVCDSMLFNFEYANRIWREFDDLNRFASRKLLEAVTVGGARGKEIASQVADTIKKALPAIPAYIDKIMHPESAKLEPGDECRKALKVWFDYGMPDGGHHTAILYFDQEGESLWCDEWSAASGISLLTDTAGELSRQYKEAVEIKAGRW